jgi:hypothetical protein
VGDIVQGDKTGTNCHRDACQEFIKLKYDKPGDVFWNYFIASIRWTGFDLWLRNW